MNEPYVPEWACSQWGNYEHDWLDCHEYLCAYEKWIEKGPEMPVTTDMKSLATAKLQAKDNWKHAYVAHAEAATVMAPDQFWKILDHLFQQIVYYRFKLGRTNGTKVACKEIGRQCWTKQLPEGVECTVEEFVSFTKAYAEVRGSMYDPLFGVVEERGDDAYGDLLDLLPLLGRKFAKWVQEGKWPKGHYDEFINSVRKRVRKRLNAINCEARYDEVLDFILKGEEYVSMSLDDAASKYLCLALHHGDA